MTDDHDDRHERDRRAGDEGGRRREGGAACAGDALDVRGDVEWDALDVRGEAEEGEGAEAEEGEGAEGEGAEAEEGEGAEGGQHQEGVHAHGHISRRDLANRARGRGRAGRGVRGSGADTERVRPRSDAEETWDQVLALSNALADIAMVMSGQKLWCVVHGDCLTLLPCLPARSIDHVVTDPPYESEAHEHQTRIKTGPYRGGDKCKLRTLEPLSFPPMNATDRAEAGRSLARVTRRWSLVFCQIEALSAWRLSLEQGEIFRYVRSCIWDKPDPTPQLSGNRPGTGYEAILAMHSIGRSRWNGGGARGVFTHSTKDFVNRDGIGDRLHPSQKPIGLMLELIQLFTDPGELVIDPYCGSGTTGAACIRTGRRFVGIEKDAAWARTATERLEAESRDQGLAEYRSGQMSIFDRANL